MKLYLYERGPKPAYYIGGYPTGKKQRSTGLSGLANRKLAEKLLASEQKDLDAIIAATGPQGPMTLTRWCATWIATLKKDGNASAARYEERIKTYVLPHIGQVPLVDLGEDHMLTLLRALKDTHLAHRSRRNVWKNVKQMLTAAVPRQIPSSPCTLIRRGHLLLPKSLDADPLWRRQAKYSAEDVATLVYDERVPLDRRVLYALLFCTGVRVGEASALRVGAYDRTKQPLGQLTVALSYQTEGRKTKGLKTDGSRGVPVHLALEAILTPWLAPGGGWAQMLGRDPDERDLIIPSRWGNNRGRYSVLAGLKRDLKKLGMRDRRIHDTRRTFISLCLDAGATKERLSWVTHGKPPGTNDDAFDGYDEPAWPVLCAQVASFPLDRPAPDARVIPMRQVAGLRGSHLQDTYNGGKSAKSKGESAPVYGSTCSAAPMGHKGTNKAITIIDGHLSVESQTSSGQPAASASIPVSRQQDTNEPHLCPAVSATYKALTALEAGDVKAAMAILRKGIQ